MDKVKLILGVSGGSYIASSRALVANDLPGSGEPGAYAPATPEERHLRNNTHYLAPGAAVVFTGVLSLLLGAAVTFVLVFAPLYAFAHAWGWLLRSQGVLAPSARHPLTASFPAWAVAVPAAAALITLLLFGWWWFTLARRTASPGVRPERSRWVWRAAVVTVFLAAVLLALPAANAWLFSLHGSGAIATIVHFFGFGRSVSWSPAALGGLIGAIMAVARFCQTGLAKWHALTGAQRIAAAGGPATSPSLLTRAGMWARQKLQPWIGSAVIVVAILAAALLWAGDGAKAGFSSGTLWPVLVAAAVALVLSFSSDVNRTSMHDFYRWRLATAFAVTRQAAAEPTPQALRKAAATRLSTLRPDGPQLVICATANVNAGGEAPPGQGGFCLTFDREKVALHREAGSAEAEPAEASTADYEALIGHDRFTVFDLSAISGAAVSPLMGSATKHAYRILFTAANIRLGVWLPHPRVVARARAHMGSEDSWWARRYGLLLVWYRARHPLWARAADRNDRREARLWAHVLGVRAAMNEPGRLRWLRRLRGALWYMAMQPSLGMLWAEAAGHLSYRSTWMYVSDGGHYENLGLVEALRRGMDKIIVLDASGDKADTWFTLGTAMELARADEEVEITLNPPSMARGGGQLRAGQVVRPWVHGTFKRRGDPGDLPAEGTITVCKLGWWGQAPWDVQAYAAHHPEYPGTSTLEQLYDGAEFEAYRELGAAAVRAVLAGEPALDVPKQAGQMSLAGHLSSAGQASPAGHVS